MNLLTRRLQLQSPQSNTRNGIGSSRPQLNNVGISSSPYSGIQLGYALSAGGSIRDARRILWYDIEGTEQEPTNPVRATDVHAPLEHVSQIPQVHDPDDEGSMDVVRATAIDPGVGPLFAENNTSQIPQLYNSDNEQSLDLISRNASHSRNQYLDLEADVDGDDEDDEDKGEDDDDFVDNDRDLEEDVSEYARRNLEDDQQNAFVDALERRWVTNRGTLPASDRSEGYHYMEYGIPPAEGDWELWEVPVRLGSEYLTVKRIYERAEGLRDNTVASPKFRLPRSAFAHKGGLGRVYIEAWEWADVIAICRRLPGVRWWEIRAVTFLEGMNLLNCPRPQFTPQAGNWVRLKARPYVNDLAFIRRVDGQNLDVVLVPRIQYYSNSSPVKLSRKRPPPALFDPNRAIAVSNKGNLSVDTSHTRYIHFKYCQEYRDTSQRFHHTHYFFDSSGFLLTTLSPSEYHHIPVYPSVDQMRPFLDSVAIPARELKVGDHVKVVGSTYTGSTGIVKALASTHAHVYLLDVFEIVLLPLYLLRKYFKVGDQVCVASGPNLGYVGFVTSINEEEFTATVHDPFRLFGKPPPHDPNARVVIAQMQDPKFDHLEKLSVVITEGPLKGCFGTVISVSQLGIAQVEMRALSVHTSILQQIRIQDMAFELEENEWYQVNADNMLEYTARLVPNFKSLLPARNRPRTPEPEAAPPLNGDDAYWAPCARDRALANQEVERPAIPSFFWLTRLPQLGKFGSLKVTIRSNSEYEEGLWDDNVGFFKSLDKDKIRVFLPPPTSKFLLVPYKYIEPCPPTDEGQLVYCLEEGKFWGKRYQILEYGDKMSGITAVKGPYKGKVIRRVPNSILALCSVFSMPKSKGLPKGLIDVEKRRPSKRSRQDVQVMAGTSVPHLKMMAEPPKAARIEEVEQEAEGFKAEDPERNHANQSSTRQQTMSARMETFSPDILGIIQAEILAQGYDEHHTNHPFHRIQEWTGLYFKKASLHDLSFAIYLGHNGSACPLNAGSTVDFTVVHINGIHNCRIGFCICSPPDHSYDRIAQLIRHQLFPSTAKNPQTVFTFEVLEDFHRHSLSAKSSAYDYYDALKMRTDATFPHHVKDRYPSMLLVMRFWRYLSLRRWAGQEHGIDSLLTHRRPNSLTVRCPACPEIGFNVEDDEMNHIYTLFISADGNFKLQRKRKNNDPNDTALNAGNAYFVENTAYKTHLKNVEKSSDKTTCAKLKVVRQQDRAKFKDAAVSGVVGIQCLRHQTWLAQGMVDLVKGEAFARTDYALAHALGMEALKYPWILLSYDVWCQYSINIETRFRKHFEPLVDKIKEMKGAIPKMHVRGHNIKCQIHHSFYYKPYTGMSCGEGIESTWSEQNHAADSTKELNEGHRHDTLDDFNGYWNWRKIIQIGRSLGRQAKRWYEELQKQQKAFDGFSQAMPKHIIDEWQSHIDAVKSNPLVFEVDDQAPSRVKVHTELVEAELYQNFGITNLVLRGLELEDILSNPAHKSLMLDEDDEDVEETPLVDRLHHWREQQLELFPQLQRFLLPIDEDRLQETKLFLPSTFSTSQRSELGLGEAAQAEILLRRGHIFDVLRAIRDWIHRRDHLNILGKVGGLGHDKKTVRVAKSEVQEQLSYLVTHYQDVYKVLENLDATDDLAPLTEDDLWVKSPFETHRSGDSSVQNPWYWSIGKPQSTPPDRWMIEVERARWFRERALLDRLREELEILNEEFRRSKKSFIKMQLTWEQMAKMAEDKQGFMAYAHRHAEMYSNMAAEVDSEWQAASQWLPSKGKEKDRW
ncbi:hypothetical protein D9756_005153 [Leucocoprinus leucothites]|uniref:KOW domain-containing protein n=1 Tax=Leucocoprinus leucothites TaxID=201217 RepID=A0A8H5LKJ9_9AGAR|nr:hypothetical protein D9756_005153 [Leucoagaricus leucothites]